MVGCGSVINLDRITMSLLSKVMFVVNQTQFTFILTKNRLKNI